MRRSEKEVTDPEVVLDVLARGEVLRLAMIADGSPYVVPLSYAAVAPHPGSLDGLRLVVHSAPEGRKIEALRRDPRVCFEVTVGAEVVRAARACDFGVRYRCVIGDGRASFVGDPEAKSRALSLIASRYGAPPGIDGAQAASVAVVEIAVDAVSRMARRHSASSGCASPRGSARRTSAATSPTRDSGGRFPRASACRSARAGGTCRHTRTTTSRSPGPWA